MRNLLKLSPAPDVAALQNTIAELERQREEKAAQVDAAQARRRGDALAAAAGDKAAQARASNAAAEAFAFMDELDGIELAITEARRRLADAEREAAAAAHRRKVERLRALADDRLDQARVAEAAVKTLAAALRAMQANAGELLRLAAELAPDEPTRETFKHELALHAEQLGHRVAEHMLGLGLLDFLPLKGVSTMGAPARGLVETETALMRRLSSAPAAAA